MGPPYKQGAGPTPFTQQRSALISWKGSLYLARSACGCVLSRSENRVTGVRAVAGVNYASEIQKEGEEYGKEQSQQALILDKSPAFRLSPVTTFEAIAVALVALLPGGLYVWGFERQVGNWGTACLIDFFDSSVPRRYFRLLLHRSPIGCGQRSFGLAERGWRALFHSGYGQLFWPTLQCHS